MLTWIPYIIRKITVQSIAIFLTSIITLHIWTTQLVPYPGIHHCSHIHGYVGAIDRDIHHAMDNPSINHGDPSLAGMRMLRRRVAVTGSFLMQPGSDASESLHWRHNGHDSVSNHQPYCCLLNCLFRRRSKIISKLRVTGLCAGNSPETGEFPAQMASNAENFSVWWRHHGSYISWGLFNNFSRGKSQVYGEFIINFPK